MPSGSALALTKAGAEVPAIPGCVTQGETFDQLLRNIYEAVEGCLSVNVEDVEISPNDLVMEIAVTAVP
ncbi:MAG: type II toxin-antitoxin system HicB family antitoxin [Thermoanaerobaculales bacterium]|nr:type II toxin-antitoxin system HicB family antitoxin [Thermoanaerobaculales bacterium]